MPGVDTSGVDTATAPIGAGGLHRLRQQLYRRLHGRPFLRHVSVTLAGVAFGQATTVLLSPVLTRLYTPQEFGALSVYSSLLTIIMVLGSLRYELAVTLTASRDEAINLAAVCCVVLVGTTTVVALVATLVPESLWQATGLAHVRYARILVPIGFAMMSLYTVGLFLAVREKVHAQIARTRIVQGLIGPLSQIAMGLLGFGATGLAAGFVMSQSGGMLGLGRAALRGHGSIARTLSPARMIALARRYSQFPLIASWAALIDAAGTQSLYIMATTSYAPRIAGYIFLAERVVARPLVMLGSSILQVFVGEAGRTARTDVEQLRRRFRQLVAGQFALAAAWVIVANIAATFLFVPIFGAAWSEGVIFLRVLSIAYLAQAVIQPVAHTLQLLERQATAAAWQIGRLILVVATFLVAARAGVGAADAILCYAVAQALASAILLTLMAQAIRRAGRESAPGRTGASDKRVEGDQ